MENISSQNSNYFNDITNETVTSGREKMFDSNNILSQDILNMVAEGGESFISYLKKLGFNREQNLIVLSSNHHYYYEKNDLKGIRTLVTLKKLNIVEHLDSFLNTLISILPPNTNFIGCFYDNKKRNGSFSFLLDHSSNLLDRFINFLDSRKFHFMNKNEVFNILERHGFNLIDITEINGITYFCSQNAPTAAELRASLKASVSKN